MTVVAAVSKCSLALALLAWAASAAAQGGDANGVLQAVFCTGAPDAGLPPGWTAHPRGTVATCGVGGIGTIESGDTKLFKTLFTDPAARLKTGRYMLTAAGAGALVQVKNGFGDQSFDARLRTVNLAGNNVIVNSVEFDWDEKRLPHGLVEVWGSGLKWLRLERLRDDVGARTPVPAIAADCAGWVAVPGAACADHGSSNLVDSRPGLAAKLTREFDLPAGRYRLALRARGAVRVQMSSGPSSVPPYLALDEVISSRDAGFASLSRPFNASGQKITLTLSALTPSKGFSFDGVAITSVVESVPSRQALAAVRPQPWPARGVTAPEAAELIPMAPRDRRGRACVRGFDRSTALEDLRRTWRADIARVDVLTVRRATRSGCRLLEDADIRADGTVDRDQFWLQAWPVILDETEQAVKAAARAGLKLVLVIDPPTPSVKLDTTPAGWVNLQARSDFARGMHELAARLASLRQHIWAYDLVNEPHEQRNNVGNLPTSQWRNLAAELIEAVREGEAAAGVPAKEGSWIVFEPGLFPSSAWPSLYGRLVPFADRRVIYSDHYYEPFAFTHQNIPQPGYPKGTLPYTGTVAEARARLQPLADFSARTGAPFYLGEFGAVVWAGWSPVGGVARCTACPCADERWQPRRDANGEPIHDSVSWLRDVMDAADALGMAWTQHSFRTYHGWDAEITPLNVPCETFVRHRRGEPDTPALRLMRGERRR